MGLSFRFCVQCVALLELNYIIVFYEDEANHLNYSLYCRVVSGLVRALGAKKIGTAGPGGHLVVTRGVRTRILHLLYVLHLKVEGYC